MMALRGAVRGAVVVVLLASCGLFNITMHVGSTVTAKPVGQNHALRSLTNEPFGNSEPTPGSPTTMATNSETPTTRENQLQLPTTEAQVGSSTAAFVEVFRTTKAPEAPKTSLSPDIENGQTCQRLGCMNVQQLLDKATFILPMLKTIYAKNSKGLPPGYQIVNDRYILLSPTLVNFAAALKYCRLNDADLFEIRTGADVDFIQQVLKKTPTKRIWLNLDYHSASKKEGTIVYPSGSYPLKHMPGDMGLAEVPALGPGQCMAFDLNLRPRYVVKNCKDTNLYVCTISFTSDRAIALLLNSFQDTVYQFAKTTLINLRNSKIACLCPLFSDPNTSIKTLFTSRPQQPTSDQLHSKNTNLYSLPERFLDITLVDLVLSLVALLSFILSTHFMCARRRAHPLCPCEQAGHRRPQTHGYSPASSPTNTKGRKKRPMKRTSAGETDKDSAQVQVPLSKLKKILKFKEPSKEPVEVNASQDDFSSTYSSEPPSMATPPTLRLRPQ
jgi:hypothetical protein